MVHPEHPIFESTLLNKLTSGSAFAIAFIFLVFQYTFKLDFQCPCNDFYQWFCGLYIGLPFIGLFLILTLTAKTFTIISALWCSCIRALWSHEDCTLGNILHVSCSCSACSRARFYQACRRFSCKNFMRNLFLSALWIITVLIDGDAVVCWNLTEENITRTNDQIPCKESNKLTAEESDKIKYYQALSQAFGLGFLFALPLLWLLVSTCCQFCTTSYYKSLFEDIYEEETIRYAEEEIRERVKTSSKKKIINVLNVPENDGLDWTYLSNQMIDLIMSRNSESMNGPPQNLPQQDQNPSLPPQNLPQQDQNPSLPPQNLPQQDQNPSLPPQNLHAALKQH
ncbi:uncharacterized protein [Sinocyclocheilus grahami]|uniref:uncharacterized protein n=1 Tax=Sinocyclocheilus grahami TaxID=75366 RepID=UPI0007ACA3E3|nr:PREDICTED: uncharacterized protein LOC107565046 [Sinocyclocheilus grahami]